MISPAFFDLYAADAAHEWVELETAYVEALTEAITYRGCFLATLERLQAATAETEALRRRLRQYMGIDSKGEGRSDGSDES